MTEPTYHLTHAQLIQALDGAIVMYLEERDTHGKDDTDARIAGVAEILAGLDADRELAATDPTERLKLQLPDVAPVITALRTLVTADNVNYARDTMRYEGLFDAGRAALLAVTGEDLTRADDDGSGPIWTPAESAPALRDMLSILLRTVNDMLRYGLTPGARASLTDLSTRAGLLLHETPSNE
jgi:hypothetical protein